MKMIIDAKNLILGRLATTVAKSALLGEQVDVVNCENAVLTGNKKNILLRYKIKKERGIHSKGPFIPTSPHMIVKRAIRGMIPYKKEKGKTAFKKIKCYMGIPDEFKDKKIETLPSADISKVPNLRYMTLKEISKRMGVK
ncbi:50S ribosomal protein L13 [Candidatus Woesearchaeota archaeon]|nr:50S ribosomal protein L13 [Candidatus Woesearchaeota archaeon]